MKFERFFEDTSNFECLEGWFPLIYDFGAEVLEIMEEGYVSAELEVVQLKEKWGTLRIYTNMSNEHVDYLIDYYEQGSKYICESCGQYGKLRTLESGWLKTLCDKHYEVYMIAISEEKDIGKYI